MAVTGTDLTGGSVGAAVTTTTEPFFSAKNGTVIYGAQIDASVPGQSLEINSVIGDMVINHGAGSKTVAFYLKVLSGTQTTGWVFDLWRNSTTNRGDLLMRPSPDLGQLRQRGNTAGATNAIVAGTPNGPSGGDYTEVVDVGELWYFEHTWVDGTGHTIKAWLPGNTSATPDFTNFAANTNIVTNTRLGNVTATMGQRVLIAGIKKNDDGTQIRTSTRVTKTHATSWDVTAGGTLTMSLNGEADPDTIRVQVKAPTAASVRLKYSVNSDMSSSSFTAGVAADATTGYVTLAATGLTANTTYYWAVEVDGVLNGTLTGKSKTLRTAGVPASYRVLWASCFDTATSGVFALAAGRSADVVLMPGDLGYGWISSGPNGGVAATDAATNRTVREAMLLTTGLRALYANAPFAHMYSDCDGGGGNADGTYPGFASGGVQLAWRQQFGTRTLPLSDCGARTWVDGRVRYILTDETTLSSDKTATDNSSKTKLGATQLAWLLGVLDTCVAELAAGTIKAIIWCGDGPWIEPANNTGTGNTWARYNTERTYVGGQISARGLASRLFRVHGDTHTLFADDGTNNSWGGFATLSAAPLHTTAQPFTPTVSGGKWPTATTNSSRHYGVIDITDDGTNFTLAFEGFSSTVSAPTEVSRFTLNKAFTRVAKTSATSWDTRARVQKTAATSYDVLTRASKTHATSWDTRARVQKTAATSYDVLSRATKTHVTSWDTRARVSKTHDTSWDVLGATSRVTKTHGTSWDTRARVAKSVVASWDVATRVSKTAATSWDVRVRVSKTSTTSWDTRGRVIKTHPTSWNVGITGPAPFREWSGSLERSLAASWWNGTAERPLTITTL